jgi:Ca2+/H+ antiporter, TMEM165/GDT1 family
MCASVTGELSRPRMEAFLVSTGLVAIAEIGDKTQLLALMLAARYRRPVPILLGILVATVANHLGAAALGALASGLLTAGWARWLLGGLFLAFAVWALIPDKLEEDSSPRSLGSVFLTTTLAFFLVEMGDKTQVATAALAARFHDVLLVAAGTTLGMLAANAPVVLMGGAAADRLPLKLIRYLAAGAFAAMGAWILLA